MKNKIFAIVLLLLFATLCVAPFLSCGSRKKEVTKTEHKSESSSKIDSSAVVKETTKLEKKKTESTEELFAEETVEYDGAPGDTLSVQKFGPDGKLVSATKISGKGKAKFSKGKKKTQSTVSESELNKKDSDIKLNVKKAASEASSTLNKNKHVESSGFTFWTWFWIILVIIIIILIICFRRYLKFPLMSP